MNIQYTAEAIEDIKYWKYNDPTKFAKIKVLLEDITKTPFSGIGKPEALRFNLRGYWSRRIDKEHRLVYTVRGDTIHVINCRFHYNS